MYLLICAKETGKINQKLKRLVNTGMWMEEGGKKE
jgi:hypothetical protein